MILNRQKKVRVALRPLREFLRKTQRELRIAGCEVTIALVSDAEIARWNETYRKKSGPTDVLSFPAGAGNGERNGSGATRNARSRDARERREGARRRRWRGARGSENLGDIAIAPEAAKRYAHKNGRTLSAELRVLILHGVLHLLGYDHETDTGQMERLERKLRRKLGIA